MARHIHLATHLSVDELEQRYRAAHEPHERTWWQILWLLARGQLAKDIAQSTGYTASWIGQIAKRYNAEGPEGMVNRQRTTSWRAPRMLSAEQQEELRALLAEAAARRAYWTGHDVAAWMSDRIGRPISYRLGWSYLVRLKHSPQVPRPQHALADPEEQERFKKN